MKKFLGALAAAALLSAPAFANDSSYEKQSTGSETEQSSQQQQPSDTETMQGTGGSGSTEMKSQEMQTGMEEAQQLQGEVIRMKGNTLYLKDQSGAAVPLKISSRTKFEGISKSELKEGTQVQAEFKLKDRTQNEAQSISMGTGGSGLEDPGSMQNQGSLDQGGSFESGDIDSRTKSNVPADESKGPAEPLPSETY